MLPVTGPPPEGDAPASGGIKGYLVHKKRTPLGPYTRTMPMVLRRS